MRDQIGGGDRLDPATEPGAERRCGDLSDERGRARSGEDDAKILPGERRRQKGVERGTAPPDGLRGLVPDSRLLRDLAVRGRAGKHGSE